jgi:hypothetical protein
MKCLDRNIKTSKQNVMLSKIEIGNPVMVRCGNLFSLCYPFLEFAGLVERAKAKEFHRGGSRRSLAAAVS